MGDVCGYKEAVGVGLCEHIGAAFVPGECFAYTLRDAGEEVATGTLS